MVRSVGSAALVLLAVLLVGGCSQTPEATQVRDTALAWLRSAPSVAAGDELIWTYGTGAGVVEVRDGAHAAGDRPFSLPVYADGDDYYYQDHSATFADEPVWVSVNPPMLKAAAPPAPAAGSASVGADASREHLQRAALVMGLLRVVSPYQLLAHLTVEGQAAEGEKREGQPVTWRIHGTATTTSGLRERLPDALWTSVQPLMAPEFDVTLEAVRETGEPTVMVVGSRRQGEATVTTYRWCRGSKEPVLPEWAVDLRSLITP